MSILPSYILLSVLPSILLMRVNKKAEKRAKQSRSKKTKCNESKLKEDSKLYYVISLRISVISLHITDPSQT